MIPVPSGLAYLSYQRTGIEFAAAREACLIGDEMGLGKTIQALGYINARPEIHSVLVVCPAGLKLNWAEEIDTWVVNEQINFDIVNYEMLHTLGAYNSWDLVIFDEAHYAKNPTTIRSKYCRSINAKRRLLLTGTPLLNRPIDLWHLLHIIDPKHMPYSSRHAFGIRYCAGHQRIIDRRGKRAWDFSGASNLDELNALLQTVMIRRLKKDVLKELPPKRRQVIELDPPKELRKALAQAADLTTMSLLRHEAGLATVPLAIPIIRDAVESCGKLVVFAWHQDVIDQLAEGLREFNPVVVTGQTPIKRRQEFKTRFQDPDSDCRVFVGQIQAAGTGITLTAASNMIFVELDWTVGNLFQAEDRIHRIGQRESVLIQYLVLKGSLDVRMLKSLIRKQKIIEQALDAGKEMDGTESGEGVYEGRGGPLRREVEGEQSLPEGVEESSGIRPGLRCVEETSCENEIGGEDLKTFMEKLEDACRSFDLMAAAQVEILNRLIRINEIIKPPSYLVPADSLDRIGNFDRKPAYPAAEATDDARKAECDNCKVDPGAGLDDDPDAKVMDAVRKLDGNPPEVRNTTLDDVKRRIFLKTELTRLGVEFTPSTRSTTLEKLYSDAMANALPPTEPVVEIPVVADAPVVPEMIEIKAETTKEQTRSALVMLTNAKGQETALKALFDAAGVNTLSEADPARYADIVALCVKRMTQE